MAEHNEPPQAGGVGPFREVLERWERQHEPDPPPFESIRRVIASAPAPMERGRWSAARSVRLAGALARAQIRIVPWLILPVALISATLAALAARFFAAMQDAPAAASGFCSVVLLGVVLTTTLALSRTDSDAVALSTPLGPQAVVLARVTVVLAVDAVCAMGATSVVAAWGLAGAFSKVAAAWLVPLALVAALVTVITIWVAPWAGVVAGLLAILVLGPLPSAGPGIGLGMVSHAIQGAIGSTGVIAAGIALFAAAIVSARRALLFRRPAI